MTTNRYLNISTEQAYASGAEAGENIRKGGAEAAERRCQQFVNWTNIQYPPSQALDLFDEIIKFDRMRMTADLDLTRFPECRGMRQLVEAARRGFADRYDNPLMLALHFNIHWFHSRVMNVSYVGRAPEPPKCTDFWFAETCEGGPIHGSNRDDIREHYLSFPEPVGGQPPKKFDRITKIGGVSSAVLCDEAPTEWFPVNMAWLDLRDLDTLPEYMKFMEHYRDFWGPGNSIYVDKHLNSVSVEKANRRMGLRYHNNGCSAITAGAYLTPEMAAFKRDRDLASFKARGLPSDCTDALYWAGCERRYKRLIKLVEAENARGATLLGAANIALDHAVPFPDRICIAGEKSHPDEALQNWSLQTFAAVLSGPNQRCLHWNMDPTKPIPIYKLTPWYLTGKDIPMRQEWLNELKLAGELGTSQPLHEPASTKLK